MPSAHGQQGHWRRERARRGALRVCLFAAVGLGSVLALCIAAVLFLVNSDWGTETLRLQAEKAVQAVTGDRATASVGPARIAVGADHPLALQLQDISFTNASTGMRMAEVGTVDFGIRLMPLMGGNLRLGSASISDATITAAAMPSANTDWTVSLRDGRGLIDPDLVATAVFKGLHGAFDAIDAGLLSEVDLRNIGIVLPEGERLRSARIVEGKLRRASPNSLEISIEADIDGRQATLTGTTVRDDAGGRIASIDLSIVMAALPEAADGGQPKSAGRLGSMTLSLAGQEDGAGQGQHLRLSGVVDKSQVDFGARGLFTGNLQLDVTLAVGTHKVEIDKFLVQTGRNSLEFNGAFGPRPPTGTADDKPAYRYELVSTKTVVAPSDSPENPLDFDARINGIFDPATRVAMADRITVRSGSGEVDGTARLEFAKGQAPGVALAVSVRDLQVSAAKQLWPWFAAGKARSWVMDHLFGGVLRQASIEFRVLPGRLGNGVPLSSEEIVGSFAVEDTRFDTAGKLPPIRDADGIVKVSGHDVEVTMSTGTVFLPSGRTVSGTNGTLTVAQSNKPPVIGKLDIDVAGEAAAVAEFAALDPINAMRVIQIEPSDLSGQVSGHVIADIPFQKSIDPKTLGWIVDLDYKDLSIAKPFSGQTLSDADGKLTVEPTQATFSATGLLNGVPAEITMVEPLRPEGPQRDRKIELTLDDAARKKMAPGLNSIVSGPVKVEVDDDGGTRRIAADLTNARLDIPWVGWSKGPGVAAAAEFTMQATDNGTRLSDFELTGNSFSVSGDMMLVGGQLASARFGKVRLNRDDDVQVTIDRAGKGYRVNVDGSGLDARPMIKTLVSESGGGAGSGGSSSSSNFSLDLDVTRVTGFNGESLSDVKLVSQGPRMSLSASTGSGAAVSFSNGTDGSRKQMRVDTADAGAILRFLDLYKNVQGGSLKVVLAGTGDGGMAGQVDARNFLVVNESRLASIVSTAPAGDDRSLSDAVRKDIDTSSVSFERGYAQIARGNGYLKLVNGVVRGPQIGATFQGTLYDAQGQMDMTGTFMPAYGINRLFGELPLVGNLLGNGRDRGLIGVTFKLDGDAKSPRLQVNPLSVMAPGIFRQIFEFN